MCNALKHVDMTRKNESYWKIVRTDRNKNDFSLNPISPAVFSSYWSLEEAGCSLAVTRWSLWVKMAQ